MPANIKVMKIVVWNQNHLRLTHCDGLNMKIEDLSIFRRSTGVKRPEMTPKMEFS